MRQINDRSGMIIGCCISLLINIPICIIFLDEATRKNAPEKVVNLAIICLFQFQFVIPIVVFLAIVSKYQCMKGVIIVSVIFFLLSAGTCFLSFGK